MSRFGIQDYIFSLIVMKKDYIFLFCDAWVSKKNNFILYTFYRITTQLIIPIRIVPLN